MWLVWGGRCQCYSIWPYKVTVACVLLLPLMCLWRVNKSFVLFYLTCIYAFLFCNRISLNEWFLWLFDGMIQKVCVCMPVIIMFDIFFYFLHLFSSLFLCQVWAVGEDRGLYFRMGVTQSEPSGNGWIPVSAQWGNSKEVIPARSVYIIELNFLIDKLCFM